MIVKSFEGGYDKNFSYLIWCNKTNIASLIDPSVDIAAIIDAIKKYNLKFKSIFITHSHHDHFSYLKDFIDIYPKINIYINYKTEFQHSLVSYVKNNQKITIGNDAGVLGRICTLIGEQNSNISDMRFEDKKPDFYRIAIMIEVRDVQHLHNVVTSLSADTDVAEVVRHRELAE